MTESAVLSRAQGCLLGQLAGDALGGLVEFQTPGQILLEYPEGVRELADGGTWNTMAGQPTDDSEMALALARMLAEKGVYDADAARAAYVRWIDSNPFDCGMTTAAGLRGHPNPESQANGALMRVSPLGIFGHTAPARALAEWARRDARITHPHPVCVEANALYARAVARAVHDGPAPLDLYGEILDWAGELDGVPSLVSAVRAAADAPPADYLSKQGWVLVALQNALWQLLHAPGLEEGVVDTVMRGGDTDTNAAICGALLGAVHGRESVPGRWVDALLSCRPGRGNPRTCHPRPECYWPADCLELAEKLATAAG